MAATVGDVKLEELVTEPATEVVKTAFVTAKSMLVVGAAYVVGSLVGDYVPMWANQLSQGNLALPPGFGIPYVASIPEQALFGHALLKDVSMGAYAALAPTIGYIAEGIRPLARAVKGQ